MLDQTHADNAIVIGRERVMQWQQKFLQAWGATYSRAVDNMVQQKLGGMTDGNGLGQIQQQAGSQGSAATAAID